MTVAAYILLYYTGLIDRIVSSLMKVIEGQLMEHVNCEMMVLVCECLRETILAIGAVLEKLHLLTPLQRRTPHLDGKIAAHGYILDHLEPQRISGVYCDIEDTQVSVFRRIQSNLPSSKLHYGKTYSNLISSATMQASLNRLQWTSESIASTDQTGDHCDCICPRVVIVHRYKIQDAK